MGPFGVIVPSLYKQNMCEYISSGESDWWEQTFLGADTNLYGINKGQSLVGNLDFIDLMTLKDNEAYLIYGFYHSLMLNRTCHLYSDEPEHTLSSCQS